MSEGEPGSGERDPILLRLELFLDGNSVEQGNVQLSRMTDFDRKAGAQLSDQELTELACRIYEARRARARFLSTSLLGEPVWDMLLALFCYTASGRRMSVSSLCFASGVPPTTALRWTRVMEGRELVERVNDSKDGRRVYLLLTAKGKEAMQRYLRSIYASLAGTAD